MNVQIAAHKWVKRRWLQTIILAVLIGVAPVSTVAAKTLSDTDITIKIEEEFLTDQSVPFDMIDATTRDGIVTLDGTVDNLLAREPELQKPFPECARSSTASRSSRHAIFPPISCVNRSRTHCYLIP